VASVDLSPSHDDRIASDDFGPFQSHDDFHRFLRWGHDNDSQNAVLVDICKAQTARPYRSALTHCDLSPRNVIVNKGKVTGIIDWELSGWFPEYWEYTRAWESMWDAPDNRALLGEWLDPYPDELRIETTRLDLVR
jgi:thiamine kinase-like enzyme